MLEIIIWSGELLHKKIAKKQTLKNKRCENPKNKSDFGL